MSNQGHVPPNWVRIRQHTPCPVAPEVSRPWFRGRTFARWGPQARANTCIPAAAGRGAPRGASERPRFTAGPRTRRGAGPNRARLNSRRTDRYGNPPGGDAAHDPPGHPAEVPRSLRQAARQPPRGRRRRDDHDAHARAAAGDRRGAHGAARAARVARAGAEEVRVAGLGRAVRRPGDRQAVDLPGDRAGARRQLPREGVAAALAAQRRGGDPRARPPVAEPRARADRPVVPARHGVQRAQQPGADEHAGLRGRRAAALPARRRPLERAGGRLRGDAEREGDPRGALDRNAVRGREEGEEARVPDHDAAGALADAARAPAEPAHPLRPRHGGRPPRARARRDDDALGGEQPRRARPLRERRLLLHPEAADAARGARRREAALAARGPDRRPGRHLQDQDALRGGQRGPAAPRDRLDPPPPAPRHERRPLGLPRQPHRDVEGRSRRDLPGPAVGRDGDAQHDRLPALQRAAHAHGRPEGRRALQRGADRRDGRRHDLPARRSLRPAPLQPARPPGDRDGQAARAAPRPRVRAGRAAPAGRAADARGRPRDAGEGPALRHLPAELGREPRAGVRRRRERAAPRAGDRPAGDPRRPPRAGGGRRASRSRRSRAARPTPSASCSAPAGSSTRAGRSPRPSSPASRSTRRRSSSRRSCGRRSTGRRRATSRSSTSSTRSTWRPTTASRS